MDEQQQLKKTQQAEQIRTEGPVTLREHLTQLQHWDTSGGQTVEQLRAEKALTMVESQTEINGTLHTQTVRSLPQAVAEQVADGVPEQLEMPARKSRKERKRDEKLDRQAKAHSKYADHVSVRMLASLTEFEQNKFNSFPAEQRNRLSDTSWRGRLFDARAITTFVHGYKKNKFGNPATRQDDLNKARDETVVRGLSSTDIEQRAVALNLVTDELLDMNLTDDMLTLQYLEKDTPKVQSMVKRLLAFQDLYSSPHNKEFFDNLPGEKKALIETRILGRYASVSMILKNLFILKGIDYDMMTYLKPADEAQAVAMARDTLPIVTQSYAEEKQQLAQRERELLAPVLEQRLARHREFLMERAQATKEIADTREDLKDIAGFGLTSFVTGFSFDNLAAYRDMIEAMPPGYVRNTELVDKLYGELYRSIDALGDLTMEGMACQDTCDLLREEHGALLSIQLPPAVRALHDAALERSIEYGRKTEFAIDHIHEVQDALSFLLRSKALSVPGARALAGVGMSEEAIEEEKRIHESGARQGAV